MCLVRCPAARELSVPLLCTPELWPTKSTCCGDGLEGGGLGYAAIYADGKETIMMGGALASTSAAERITGGWPALRPDLQRRLQDRDNMLLNHEDRDDMLFNFPRA